MKGWRRSTRTSSAACRFRRSGTCPARGSTGPGERPSSAPDLPGFAHVAFEVDDVEATARAVFENGGSAIGELTQCELPGVGVITF